MTKSRRQYGIPELPEVLPTLNVSANVPTLFDMHCHLDMVIEHLKRVDAEIVAKNLDDQQANSAREPRKLVEIPTLHEIAQMSVDVGINGLIQCACEINAAQQLSTVLDELSEVQGCVVFGAAAIHPNEATLHAAGGGGQKELLKTAADGLEPPRLRERHLKFDVDGAVLEIERVIKTDARIRIVGETGLDYFRSPENAKSAQLKSFRSHIKLAKERDLPLQIHDRDAHADVIGTLKADGAPATVLFHSFSGDTEMAKVCAESGWYMSFSGPVTFKTNTELLDAFGWVWHNAPHLLLIETDSPFLTPHPFRGRTNIPAMIPYTLRFVAGSLEIPLEGLCQQVSENQARILG